MLKAKLQYHYAQRKTDEEREAARKGRIECSDPLVIPGPTSEPSAAPYPPC
jgi:hypothetical protein